jgi:hypothetical protein
MTPRVMAGLDPAIHAVSRALPRGCPPKELAWPIIGLNECALLLPLREKVTFA